MPFQKKIDELETKNDIIGLEKKVFTTLTTQQEIRHLEFLLAFQDRISICILQLMFDFRPSDT